MHKTENSINIIESFEELDEYISKYSNYSEQYRFEHWKHAKLSEGMFSDTIDALNNLDPFSDDYSEAITNFYNKLHKKNYNLSNEGFNIEDTNQFSKIGFPYYTKSAAIVGNYLMAYGFIIRAMNLKAEAKILDIGTGPGSLTIHLMKMGYQLTCVDINHNYTELMETIAKDIGVQVKTLCCDMSQISVSEKFDAVIFMESFHHTLNHTETLSIVSQCIKEDGKIFFAAEPIVDSYDNVPYPWGPRLDFESINSIRNYGWIEMGYQEEYFRELLFRHGLSYQRTRSNETWWGDVITSKKLPILHTDTLYKFSQAGNGISFLGPGWSDPESNFTWSNSHEAYISFFLDKKVKPSLEIDIEFLAFLDNQHEHQIIDVHVNGKHIDKWKIKGNRVRDFRKMISINTTHSIPKFLIKLVINNPIAPNDIGVNADTRMLGIALISLTGSC